MGYLERVTDESFERDVIGKAQPTLVHFWAAWVAGCRLLGPVLDEVADTYSGRVSVVVLDVDSNQETALRHGVQSLPALIVFRDGRERARILGAQPVKVVARLIDEALAQP